MLGTNEIKSIGISAGLVLANIALVWILLFTPLATVNSYLFEYLIIGMIFYGAMLTIGNYLGRQGIKHQNMGKALGGIALLQLAYGMFGAGVLSILGTTEPSLIATVLGITAGITLAITFAAAGLVYGTGKNFRSWSKYSMYSFLAALGAGFIGSFSGIFGLITFVLVMLGFLLNLVYEIWEMKSQNRDPYLNGLGIYIAFMGVFVHILRMIAEYYLRE